MFCYTMLLCVLMHSNVLIWFDLMNDLKQNTMEYNEAKKVLEDLGIDPEEVGKRGEKTVSEIMDKAKAMNQNESISHVSGIYDSKHDPDTWWCPTCNEWVCSVDVTFEETHDPRYGGCGGDVE